MNDAYVSQLVSSPLSILKILDWGFMLEINKDCFDGNSNEGSGILIYALPRDLQQLMTK